jgi:hypothetical protein
MPPLIWQTRLTEVPRELPSSTIVGHSRDVHRTKCPMGAPLSPHSPMLEALAVILVIL